MQKIQPFAIWALTLLVLTACTTKPAAPVSAAANLACKNADGYVDISVDQLVKTMETQDLTQVNVHIPY